jgi:aminotransferase
MAPEDRGPALSRVRPLVNESERSPMGAMKAIMQANPDIVNMAIGEADFDPPALLIDIACRMLRDRDQRRSLYTSTRGLPQTRAAVARFVERAFAATVDPEEEMLMTVGGTEALHLAIKVLVGTGDAVLLPDPGWGPCAALMKRQGAEIRYYPLVREGVGSTEDTAGPGKPSPVRARTDAAARSGNEAAGSWTVDAEAVVARLDPRVKVLVVNSPSNPTGAMLSADGWAQVMHAARANDVIVISDEVYHGYSYVGPYASALPLDRGLTNLVVINSFSKAFAVMGWRTGFALAHPWLIRQMDVYKETVSACTPSIPQWALAEYLDTADCDAYLDWAAGFCRENMQRAVARLNSIPGVDCPPPQGGFYLFPDLSDVETSSAVLAERLLRGGVAVAMGASFGPHGEGCARLLFSAHWTEIERALDRIAVALAD